MYALRYHRSGGKRNTQGMKMERDNLHELVVFLALPGNPTRTGGDKKKILNQGTNFP